MPENEAVDYITEKIKKNLKLQKDVLFLVSGGSAMNIVIKVAEFLRDFPQEKLTVSLIDERYGKVGHPDSNWQKLLEKGLNFSGAKLVPVLIGEDAQNTTAKFNAFLEEEFSKDSFKIGLFGIGSDGHTAGILPNSPALNSKEYACYYETETFKRITTTEKVIRGLDEAVVFALGEEKWPVISKMKEALDPSLHPAQLLKRAKFLKIFSDMPSA